MNNEIFYSNYSGADLDRMIKTMLNICPQITISGLDIDSTINCDCSDPVVSISNTVTDDDVVIKIPAYGTYILSGIKNGETVTNTLTIDHAKVYTVSF